MNKELRRRFDAEVERLFVTAGWRKRNRKTFTRPIGDDIDAQVGVDDSAAGEWLHIIVSVGVRCNEVHRIIAHLDGERPHAYDPATLGYALSHFAENKSECYFLVSHENVAAVAGVIHELVERYGRPFWEKHRSIESIVATIDEADFRDLRKTRAVLYYLGGNADRAKRYVANELAMMKNPRWEGNFEVFTERFIAMVDTQGHRGRGC